MPKLTAEHLTDKYGIINLLRSTIDSGKLILVDPDIRGVGKTQSLIVVALETKLPIFVDNVSQARNINLRAESIPGRHFGPIAFTSVDKILNFTRGRDARFLVDEGVRLDQITRLLNESRPLRPVKLATGFFTNHYF